MTPVNSVDVDLYCGVQAPSDTSGTVNLPSYGASSSAGSGSTDTVDLVPAGATPVSSSSYSRASFTPGSTPQLWCAVYGYSSASVLSFTIRVTTFTVVSPSAAATPSATATPVVAQSLTAQMGPQPIYNALLTDQYSYFWAPAPSTGLRVTVATIGSGTAVTFECGTAPPQSTSGTFGLGGSALLTGYASTTPTPMDLLPADALPDPATTSPLSVFYDVPSAGSSSPSSSSATTIWCAVRGYAVDYFASTARYYITAQTLNSSSGAGQGLDGIPPPCARAADIVWVVDGSGSIGSDNFELVRRLIDDFALLFPISPQPSSGDAVGIRMAAVEFASQGDGLSVIPLSGAGAAGSSAAFIRSVRGLPYFAGGTDTAYGIGGGMGQLRSFPRGPSTGAARVLIVLTDGYSDSQAATLAAADDVRSLGVAIAVITVGRSINWVEIVGMAGPAGSAGGDASYVFALEDWNRLRSVVGGNAGFLANFSRVVCEAPAIVPAGPAAVQPQLTCSNATAGVPGGAPVRFEVDTSASVSLSAELAGGGTLTLCYAMGEAPPQWLAVSAALAASPTSTAPLPGVTCTRAAADPASRQAVAATTVLQRPAPEPGSFLQTALFATAGLPVPGSVGSFNVSCGGPARVVASYCAVLIVGSASSANPSGMRWFGNPAAGMCSRCPPGTTAGPSASTASPPATAPFTCIDTSSRFAADVGAGVVPVYPSAAPTPSGTPRPIGASPSPPASSYNYASPSRTATRSRSRGSSPAPGSGSGSGIGGSGDWWLSPSPSQDPSIAFGFLISGGANSGGLTPGAIVGIVAGVAVVGVMVTVALLCACRGNPACPCSDAAVRRRAGLPANDKLAYGVGGQGPQGQQTTHIAMQMQQQQQYMQQQMPSPYSPYFGGFGSPGSGPASPAMAPPPGGAAGSNPYGNGGGNGGGAATFMFSHPMMAAQAQGSPQAATMGVGRAAHFKMARSSMMAGASAAAAAAAGAGGQRYAAAPTASGGMGGGGGTDDPMPYAYPVPLAQPYMQQGLMSPQAAGLAPPYPAYTPAFAAAGGFRPLAAVPIAGAAPGLVGGASSRGLRTASNGGGLRSPSGNLRTASNGLRSTSSRGLRTPSAGGGLRTASTNNALRSASSNLNASRGVSFADGQAARMSISGAASGSAEDPSRIAGAVSRSNSRSFDPSIGAAGAGSAASAFADGDASGNASAIGAARHAANIKLLGAYGASAAVAALARPGGGRARPSLAQRAGGSAAVAAAAGSAGTGAGAGADGDEPRAVTADALPSELANSKAYSPVEAAHDHDDGDSSDDDNDHAASSGAEAFSALRLPLDPALAAYIGCDAASGALLNPAAFAAYWLFLTGTAPDFAATYARLERLMHDSDAAREGLAAAVAGGSFNGGAAFLHDYFSSGSPAAAAVLADVGAGGGGAGASAGGGSPGAVSAVSNGAAAAPGAAAPRAPRASRKTLTRAQQAVLLAAPPPPARMMVLPATVRHKTAVVVKERIVLRRAGMGGAAGGTAAGGAGAAVSSGVGVGVGVSSRGVVAFEGVKERRLVETETARSPRPQQQPARKAT